VVISDFVVRSFILLYCLLRIPYWPLLLSAAYVPFTLELGFCYRKVEEVLFACDKDFWIEPSCCVEYV
jgi:hypothetical protein